MKNSIVVALIFLSFLGGLLLALIQMYSPISQNPSLSVASYYYLIAAVVILLLVQFMQKNMSRRVKIFINIILPLFALFGLLLALICMYSSPIDAHNPLFAASLFFLAGMLGAGASAFVKSEKSGTSREIGLVQKSFRIIILFILLLVLGSFTVRHFLQ